MKKTILFLNVFLLFLAITSCSDNDKDSVSDNKGYCNVTINGETLHHEFEEGMTFSYGGTNCASNNSLRLQNVEQFEKSSYFLDLYFVHNENLVDFKGYNIAKTFVKDLGVDYVNPQCFNNLDLIVEYEDKTSGKTLKFNSSSINFSKIESVSIYKEDSEEIIYAVKGNFEVSYKKSDNTIIPVKGNYKTFIYVLK